MRIKSLFWIFSFVLSAFSITGCKKDRNNNNNNNDPQASQLNELFKQLKSQPQTFTVKSGEYVTIQGAGGTVIKFHPESFVDKDNNYVVSGINLKVTLTEALDYRAMIANRVQTITENKQRLISGGAVKVEVSFEDTEIYVRDYSVSFLTTENPPSDLMALYTGYESSQPAGNVVMWYDDTTGTTKSNRMDNNINGGVNLYFTFDSVTTLGWINCDYFFNHTGPKTDIGVTFPDNTFNEKNTEVYVVFPQINSVSGLYNYLPNANSFTMGYAGYHIPVGSVIHVMTVTEKNNQYYMAVQKDITVTHNHTVNVSPQPATFAEITTALQGL